MFARAVSQALLEEAVVHDDFYTGGFGFGGGFGVDDAFLQPEIGDFVTDDGVDDFGNEFRAAEDVDELNFAGMCGDRGVEVNESWFAEG